MASASLFGRVSSSMMDTLPSLSVLIPSVILVILLGRAGHNFFLHPLKSIPGPRFGAITRLYELALYSTGKSHEYYQRLHERYGPIVRISPNVVIVNHPRHLAQIWSWPKSEWWLAIVVNPRVLSHNNERDIKAHMVAKKKIAGAYSMSSVARYEGIIDKHIVDFTGQMRGRSREGKIFDLSPWMQWVAFDIVMDVVFSNPLGFVSQARDVDGLIASLHAMLHAANVIAILPFLAKMILHPVAQKLVAPKPTDKSGPGKIHGLAYEQVRQRLKLLAATETGVSQKEKPDDVLQRILEQNKERGTDMSIELLEQESIAPILAGSDSVASHLRSALLYVASTSHVLNRLQAEIDAAEKAGKLSPIAQYNEIREYLPYVELINKEVSRIYPVVVSPLPRTVPKDGAVIHGYHLPEGTNIGVSQWCVGRNTEVFGDDVELFRPERWQTDSKKATESTRKQHSNTVDEETSLEEVEGLTKDIEVAHIPFHAGPMMCTGKHIALQEINKVLVEFFRHFNIQMANVRQPWKWDENHLAMLCGGFDVRITDRRSTDK